MPQRGAGLWICVEGVEGIWGFFEIKAWPGSYLKFEI
jgi:hypothetical protein